MKLCQELNQLVRCPGSESSTSETVQTLTKRGNAHSSRHRVSMRRCDSRTLMRIE